MSQPLRTVVAEFGSEHALTAAMSKLSEGGFLARDALTPYPVEALSHALALRPSRVRWAMLAGGLAAAALAYATEWYSAVVDYPFNTGGRPLNSWPVFVLVPFEVGVLAAALCGLVAFLLACGLPRLNNPLFAVPGIERATVDRFFLVYDIVAESEAHRRLVALLVDAHALRVEGVSA